MNNIQSISHFWPEIILVITAIVVISLDLIFRSKDSNRLKWWAFTGVVVTLWILISDYGQPVNSLFIRQIAFDTYGTFFKQLILIATGFSLLVYSQNQGI